MTSRAGVTIWLWYYRIRHRIKVWPKWSIRTVPKNAHKLTPTLSEFEIWWTYFNRNLKLTLKNLTLTLVTFRNLLAETKKNPRVAFRQRGSLIQTKMNFCHLLNKRSINSLGDTLWNRGLLYASQFCYLLANGPKCFGFFNRKNCKVVLLGGDHTYVLFSYVFSWKTFLSFVFFVIIFLIVI